jgi:hypothetical protein
MSLILKDEIVERILIKKKLAKAKQNQQNELG